MYFPYFITYMVVGLAISLLAFFWALKNGQFKDQKRARFLPLADEQEPPATKVSKIKPYEIYTLIFLVLAGLAASAAALVFSILKIHH
jgi:cbb3-type cytochrome oxidase maturation protein